MAPSAKALRNYHGPTARGRQNVSIVGRPTRRTPSPYALDGRARLLAKALGVACRNLQKPSGISDPGYNSDPAERVA